MKSDILGRNDPNRSLGNHGGTRNEQAVSANMFGSNNLRQQQQDRLQNQVSHLEGPAESDSGGTQQCVKNC